MKQTLYFATLLLFLASTPFSAVCAQQNSAEFVSLSEQFAIKLPARYDEYKPFVPLKVGSEDYSLRLYKWNARCGLITVGYASGTMDLEEPDRSKRFFADFRKLILSRIADKGRLVDERSIVLQTHPGLELVAENSGLVNAFRIFLVRNRFYMLALVTGPGQRDSSPTGEEVLLSFRLLSRSEVVAVRDRILGSLDWSPLPRDPSYTRPKTDAEDGYFKGQVKQVLTESEYFYDGALFGIRTSDEMKEFNEKGYLTREVHFENESPISITSFDHVNGTLVSKKVVMGLSGNGQPIGLSPTRTGKQITRETKFKYREDGRLSQIKVFENGEMVEQRIFSYSQNKRETETWEYFRVLRASAEARSKLSEILDASGNPLEATESRYQNAPEHSSTTGGSYEQKVSEEKSTYTYEFDSQGNWTKRITFNLTSEKGKAKRMPQLVTYRTITYYQ